MNHYLKNLAWSRVRTLQEVIDFNYTHAELELPKGASLSNLGQRRHSFDASVPKPVGAGKCTELKFVRGGAPRFPGHIPPNYGCQRH